MEQRRDIRVSDGERQVAADRLRAAMDEGRLDLFEYDERLALAYRSQTYADLDQLFLDLPVRSALSAPAAVGPAATPTRAVSAPAQPLPVRVPTPLRILWTVWAAVVAINLTVWLLVSVGNEQLDYFWPAWLLVPGAALGAVTVGVMSQRRERAARRARHLAAVAAARRPR